MGAIMTPPTRVATKSSGRIRFYLDSGHLELSWSHRCNTFKDIDGVGYKDIEHPRANHEDSHPNRNNLGNKLRSLGASRCHENRDDKTNRNTDTHMGVETLALRTSIPVKTSMTVEMVIRNS